MTRKKYIETKLVHSLKQIPNASSLVISAHNASKNASSRRPRNLTIYNLPELSDPRRNNRAPKSSFESSLGSAGQVRARQGYNQLNSQIKARRGRMTGTLAKSSFNDTVALTVVQVPARQRLAGPNRTAGPPEPDHFRRADDEALADSGQHRL